MAQKKDYNDNVCHCLEGDRVKETKNEKEKTSKVEICNICGISFIYEEGIFDNVSYIHNNCTICNSQFNDLKSLNHFLFVLKHKFEFFKS